MTYKTRLIVPILILMATSCNDKVLYLDNDYPDLIPKKYANGIINIEGRFQQNLTMSPDGKEHLFTVTDSLLWRYERILRVKNIRNKVLIDTPQFVTNFKYEKEQFIGEPMISPDNQNLYFIADFPSDLWNSKRTNTGDWSKPVKMDELNTEKSDWYVTVSKNNDLYFTNDTLYKSTMENGKYVTKEKIETSFSQTEIGDICISPNGDYLIFTASNSVNNAQKDLFISFNNGNGNWSIAQNLGTNINTKYREFAPYISPDEKFLFFSRRDKWNNASFSTIYWVSLKVIDKFRS